MIELGVNSVLFGGYDFATAAKYIALAGYDGIEISAIKGMCEHLELDRWREQADKLRNIVAENGLKFLSMEVASLDEDRLTKAFEAGAEIGIPIVNVGPGGKADADGDLERQIDLLAKMSEKAETYGITLCVKAHVGLAIYNTPTTLKAMDSIHSPAFGIDMDPSHIYRAGEDPAQALMQVIGRVKHIHIRDCLGRNTGPGIPANQACGRGDIDLMAYCKVMVDNDYSGPVCLEVIGANDLELPEVVAIAAESRGYLNACLKALGAR
ncbi:sugar phosphate isomerase/epimerase family protein [Mahella australiensis]|uniref:Xylose isomerase domain-containing protein TIM barrel n=1 Tax=Mahella australiensis (strain DSM 15567 / CIP 107919 / 50-1 BON) TaxID=697281 RepID=F3ZW29_MAHA5|nr:sugar phosphate isomerase/epimerase [Mahella australiensis]AEE96409.1 Xylose isomerase domain-containing protein TIM barrel [Mahella australiensis 50-1 BON]